MTRYISKQKLIFLIVVGVLLFILLGGFIIWRIPKTPDPITLEFWSVFDDSDKYASLISRFNQQYPWITIRYKKFSYEEYERSLLDAWSLGEGPDIFSIHNTWAPKHKNHIYPLPQDNQDIGMTVKQYGNTFMPVASTDFIIDNQIYAIPLSVDTLALYYNEGVLQEIYRENPDEAWILTPPETWEDFIRTVKYVTKKDPWGNIQRAGATLGTSNNVNQAADILAWIMLQSGTQMVASNLESATFDKTITANGVAYSPGEQSLEFYTSFANPRKEVYTWNRKRDYSIDDFAEVDAVMTIGYSYLMNTFESRNPNLNYKVAPVPQLKDSSQDINYANYWGQAVSRFSAHPKEAWQFIRFATDPNNLAIYLQATNRPTSRMDMLSWQQGQNEQLAIFVKQAMTAQSWYQEDADAVQKIFLEMIEKVNIGEATVSKAIYDAAKELTNVMKPGPVDPEPPKSPLDF
jgi:multiple sugar transport system substrate-binding protein